MFVLKLAEMLEGDDAGFVISARNEIGAARGLGRSLTPSELAGLVGVGASMINKLESERAKLSGPVRTSISILIKNPQLVAEPGDLDLATARARLGDMWGLERPLTFAELSRALSLSPKWGGMTMGRVESGVVALSSYVAIAIKLMVAGGVPPAMADVIRPGYPRAPRVVE